ncbi:MAG TPA: NADH-ubiquinone oxidoreductase-F iron-sulfur binding region domain-containing protein [Phototrophicaceae bacterium]|nr:NADH-ubiquinone oxidoreductase-F iron-sulfur binding region domain-containing protein [Phototrophicaceae bacterium]
MNQDELREIATQRREQQAQFQNHLVVCTGTACHAAQSDQVLENLQTAAKQRGLSKRCLITGGGCRGLCAAGPMVTVEPEDLVYQGVKPDDASAILDSLDKQPIERLRCDTEAPFFARQKKIVLEHNGMLDPEEIEDYIAVGGYTTFLNVLTQMQPSEVIEVVRRSGLGGRGGAGYSTGLKWSTVAKAPGQHKFIVCNGDEGDPGAFMDRSVMEDYPYRVIEGMLIAAYAVGADEGFIYVRAEYPLAVKRLRHAIREAEKLGLLGLNIAGTPFSMKLDVRLGAGAFVCGEETALMASIEGRRGTPRPRPPYPAESGLWGFPTLINNVETFANVVAILREGSDWFASIGTERSKGTKVFALSGQINHTGLIEVPMGITLREIVFEIGGGIPGGRKFKAVQTGGPSGGCIPEQYLDIPVDYASLAQVGSIMGSGGMIVMDETSCMVDVAKYFMEFCMSESCGKCIPCRVGTAQMYRLLDKITHGDGTLDDLQLLEDLCDMVRHTSLCGLGQAAPNPVLSTLRYFRDEYLAHIIEKRCPAGVCSLHREAVSL